MAMKRLTIELDDVPDSDRRTASPSALMRHEGVFPIRQSRTDVPSRQPDYQDPDIKRSPETPYVREVIGRTPADLVHAFMNHPEFMATALVFLPFLIPVGKLQTLADLGIRLVISLILNVVWFGLRWLQRLVGLKRIKGRQ